MLTVVRKRTTFFDFRTYLKSRRTRFRNIDRWKERVPVPDPQLLRHVNKMSDIAKDVGKVWDRLFDHKGFLSGEIGFMLREFEQKRGDREVDNLFRVIENITEIKGAEIDRCNQAGDQTLQRANEELEQALDICGRFTDLEEKYKQDNTIEETRSKRKLIWDTFMDGITTEYSEINSGFEAKEESLIKLYEEFEKKLLV